MKFYLLLVAVFLVLAAFSTTIFLLVFFMLSQVHPAFQITVTPLIILLAFIVLALSAIVISIIIHKFEEQLERIRQETSKVYEADVGRLSASAAAFALGISNMRKRRSRTILTCGTLVILTFTVISFTSVRAFVQSNKTRLPSVRPSYTGMLIRNQYWNSLEEPVYAYIKNDLESTEVPLDEEAMIRVDNPISARSWYFSSALGDQSFVDLVADSGKKFTATALLGMSDTPILIAALIVLNTMLGAVYERVREIGIYSAVGLAPVQVAFLFIAEACVYAIIGGILGYLLGRATARALVKWGLLAGLTLNYSSMSTVTSTIIVMLVVLGSTIYPAAEASRMVVPDMGEEI